jgi:hypothetical protein
MCNIAAEFGIYLLRILYLKEALGYYCEDTCIPTYPGRYLGRHVIHAHVMPYLSFPSLESVSSCPPLLTSSDGSLQGSMLIP